MKPVNNKSLLATQYIWIEKIENDETASLMQKAPLIIGLSKNAISLVIHEATRAKLLSDPAIKKEFRNIELKDFDSMPG